MSDDLSRTVRSAVEATISSGSARYRWRMDVEDGELGSGEGMINFVLSRASMRSRFTVPADTEDTVPGDPQTVENLSIIDGGTLYTMQPVEGGPQPAPWIAIDLGFAGLGATPVGLLLWLRGVTGATPAPLTVPPPAISQLRLDLDLDLAVRRAPDGERTDVRASLEAGRVGLSDAVTQAEVALDDAGRVCWMRSAVPAGSSPYFSVAHGEDRVELAFSEFGRPVPVPVPDAEHRLSVTEFLASIEVTSDAADTGPTPAFWGWSPPS